MSQQQENNKRLKLNIIRNMVNEGHDNTTRKSTVLRTKGEEMKSRKTQREVIRKSERSFQQQDTVTLFVQHISDTS